MVPKKDCQKKGTSRFCTYLVCLNSLETVFFGPFFLGTLSDLWMCQSVTPIWKPKMSPKTQNPKKPHHQKQLTACCLPSELSLPRALSLSLSPSPRLFFIHSRVCRLNRSDPARSPRDLLHFSQRIDLQRDRGVYGSPSSSPATSLGCARRRRRRRRRAPKLIMSCGGS